MIIYKQILKLSQLQHLNLKFNHDFPKKVEYILKSIFHLYYRINHLYLLQLCHYATQYAQNTKINWDYL